mmetsp:Transcript_34219/g.59873  ORF Transcript_34219/g.59873 Transcript_34219/m.59873 type:complete len:1019 (-) Transcript_34219:24-3080(-)
MSYAAEKERLASLGNFTVFKVTNSVEVAAAVDFDSRHVTFVSSTPGPLTMHWGAGLAKPREWKSPSNLPDVRLPEGTNQLNESAIQSPFHASSPYSTLEFDLPGVLALNFVFKDDHSWFNNGGKDFFFSLEPTTHLDVSGPVASMVEEIINAEANFGSWTLMHRFGMCERWVEQLGDSREACLWIYVWMRYSAMRKLDWQRRFNTKPKDLSWAQRQLTYAITRKLSSAQKTPLLSPLRLLRSVLGTLGKGGDNGQRIRDQILEIMHRNGVKEVSGTFYEQWHQKLHNNTTPDDVGICEAVIAFNESNDMGRFKQVLASHGIDEARLASYERPITTKPEYKPHLIGDLKEYLKTLKSVHGSSDLSDLLVQAKWASSHGLNGLIDDVLGNFFHWDTLKQMERVTAARTTLVHELNYGDHNKARDLNFADIAMEGYVRLLAEKIMAQELKPLHLFWELNMLIANFCLTSESTEARIVQTDFKHFSDTQWGSFETNPLAAKVIKAASDRVLRLIGTYIDEHNIDLAPKATHLGKGCNIDPMTVELFTEESVRGSLMFAISMVSRKLDAHLRRATGLNTWQIISPSAKAQGRVVVVDSVADVQYTKYDEATVLIAHRVSGEEEVPDGVTTLITGSELDALAHISVRARNGHVLLAVCHDADVLEQIKQKSGRTVKVVLRAGGIDFEQIEELKAEASESITCESLPTPPPVDRLILPAEDFSRETSGAKSNNCAFLFTHAGRLFTVPESFVLPYGVCELLLERSSHLEEFNGLIEQLHAGQDVKDNLKKLKNIVRSLEVTEEQKAELIEGLVRVGVKTAEWDAAWKAIKEVWASKFNERAFISTKKVKIPLEQIRMSVLCQRVISADYAFVLHTKNPTNDNAAELYGELVVGLGETLVGSYEGRALSFVVDKASRRFEILAFPNKSVALKGEGYIFRSDSNSEDLPGFAGAGLFDSVMMNKAHEEPVSYAACPIFTDERFRNSLITRLLEVGQEIERLYEGQPQDIEGVFLEDRIYVVQTRPQV